MLSAIRQNDQRRKGIRFQLDTMADLPEVRGHSKRLYALKLPVNSDLSDSMISISLSAIASPN
jgi:hypothetical protein